MSSKINQPTWTCSISNLSIRRGSKSLSINDDDIVKQVTSILQDPNFQWHLNKTFGTPLSLKLKVIIEGDTFRILDSNGTPIECPSMSFKQTTEIVNTLATKLLAKTDQHPVSTQPTAPPAQSKNLPIVKSTKTSPAIQDSFSIAKSIPPKIEHSLAGVNLKEYNLHGLTNDNTYCYANSAYQLAVNIPSFKHEIIDKIPGRPLSDYKKITSGSTLVKELNKLTTPQNALISGKANDSSDVFDRLLNASKGDFSHALTVSSDYDVDNARFSATLSTQDRLSIVQGIVGCDHNYHKTSETNTTSITLPLSNENDFINFPQSFFHYLHTSSTEERDGISYKLQEHKRFKKAPGQLLIKFGRKDLHKPINKKPISNIPLILNLNHYSAMIPSETARPLELKGFTVHYGADSNIGHYVSYFQKAHPHTGKYQWFCANDSIMTAVTEEHVREAVAHANELYYDDQLTSKT